MEQDSNEESYDPNDPVWKYCQVVYRGDAKAAPKLGTCPTNKNVNFDLEPSKKRLRLAGPTDNISTVGNDKRTDARNKELWEKACMHFSHWFFEAGIPFSAIYSPSFQKMVDAIGEFGPGAIGPTQEELAGPLLDKAVEDVKSRYVNPCKEEWAVHGCTLMVDSWTGKDDSGECEGMFINFLVNSPIGSVFMQSVDASGYADNGNKLFEVIDRFVELVGESKVVQVITANSSAMVLAGTLLETKRPNLYWAPCVSRCVNSILEDISQIPSFKASLKKVENVISYIYIRPCVVNMLRQLTGQEDLVRAGITTLATAFLTLERMHSLRRKLCYMVISQEWEESEWNKEARGEMITKTILSTRFWDNVERMLKIYRPLIRVWRLVDGEKRPSMGYIYDAMSKAKEAIRVGFDGKEKKYKEAWEIIDKRWDRLKPLHAAGHYLNPVFFDMYKDGMIVPEEVADGFISSVERLVLDHDEQEKITTQVCVYRRAEGLFGKNIATRQRSTLSPVEWWQLFGAKTPELQKFAIKVLSLTCSAVGSERNWSIFKHIHKRRNKLVRMCWEKRLYVKYNQALKLRYKGRRDRFYAMKDTDDHDNEWLVGNMHEMCDSEESVFEGGELTWDTVATAIGAADELALKIVKSKGVEEGKENENEKGNASPSFGSWQAEDEEKVNEKYECMIDKEDENKIEDEEKVYEKYEFMIDKEDENKIEDEDEDDDDDDENEDEDDDDE